jgi:hypothetical protein
LQVLLSAEIFYQPIVKRRIHWRGCTKPKSLITYHKFNGFNYKCWILKLKREKN